jgi:hypothetical protein
MNAWVWFAAIVVLTVWVVAAFVIRRWGPGRFRRRVFCPDQKVPTHVVAVASEAGYGAIRTTDIVRCDLLGPGPVTCEKRCLVRM